MRVFSPVLSPEVCLAQLFFFFFFEAGNKSQGCIASLNLQDRVFTSIRL